MKKQKNQYTVRVAYKLCEYYDVNAVSEERAIKQALKKASEASLNDFIQVGDGEGRVTRINDEPVDWENRKYVEEFRTAFKAMKARAIEVMMKYDGTLDVVEILKKRILDMHGMDEWPASNTDVWDELDEELDELKSTELYCCAFTGKYETVYNTNIDAVRWNKEKKMLEVYLHSDDGYINEWIPETYVDFDQEAIYFTILEFADQK